jgi:hypothetical protein
MEWPPLKENEFFVYKVDAKSEKGTAIKYRLTMLKVLVIMFAFCDCLKNTI